MTEVFATMGVAEFAVWILALSLLRYWIIAGVPFLVLYVSRPKWTRRFKVQAADPPKDQVRREFLWGNVSSVLIALSLTAAFAGFRAGWSEIYLQPEEFGRGWYYASIGVMALIHDAWFYATHRLLHQPVFFRRFHAIHHRSLNPTPLASLSFHPVEEVLSFGFFPLMLLVLPFHPVPLAWFFVLMFAGNVSGHSGFEFGRLSPLTRYLGGSIHHNLHHTRVKKNFGLYTNFWDLLFGTLDEGYIQEFQRLETLSRKSHDGAA